MAQAPTATIRNDVLAVPSHDIGSLWSGLPGVGRKAIGERGDQVAQFIGALDDERPVEFVTLVIVAAVLVAPGALMYVWSHAASGGGGVDTLRSSAD